MTKNLRPFFSYLLLFLSVNTAFRFPYLLELGLLNEDAALLSSALETVKAKGFLIFLTPMGPDVIRPFQVLGLALQSLLFGKDTLFMHLFSLLLFSLSQSILILFLRKVSATSIAFGSVLLLSVARASAEPLYWLSDQHDLYLFFFFSAALLTTHRFMEDRSEKKLFLKIISIFLLTWGCFLSNEKGIAVPLLLFLSGFIFHQRERKDRKLLYLGALTLLNISGFFLFRYLILGNFIGGYDNSLLPASGVSLITTLYHWSFALLTAPFLQSTKQTGFWMSLAGGLAFLFIALSGMKGKEGGWKKLFFFLLALIIASAPTYKYFGPPPHQGVFSTRMYWLPLIIWSCSLSYFTTEALKTRVNFLHRTGLVASFVLALLISANGGRDSLKQITYANRITLAALSAVSQYCPCLNPKKPSVRGLPIHLRSVNSFTEPGWLESLALYSGFRSCSTPTCRISMQIERGEKVAISPQVLPKEMLRDLPQLSDIRISEGHSVIGEKKVKPRKNFISLIFEVSNSLKENFTPAIGVLYIDNSPLLFSKHPSAKSGNIQFHFRIPNDIIKAGEHHYSFAILKDAASPRDGVIITSGSFLLP